MLMSAFQTGGVVVHRDDGRALVPDERWTTVAPLPPSDPTHPRPRRDVLASRTGIIFVHRVAGQCLPLSPIVVLQCNSVLRCSLIYCTMGSRNRRLWVGASNCHAVYALRGPGEECGLHLAGNRDIGNLPARPVPPVVSRLHARIAIT